MNDPKEPVELYLDIMKKTLSFALWEDPGIPIELLNYKRNALSRLFMGFVFALLRRADLTLVKKLNYDEEQKALGKIFPVLAHTMIGLKRLDHLQDCIETILLEDIPGDLIETGVWRGGASIFMRAVLAAHRVTDRRVYVADSFEGLPKPDVEQYPQDKRDKHYRRPYLAVSKEEVEENFEKYGLLDDQVVFLKGWFKDTLPAAPLERLSVMRLDGDMYQSTMESLIHLYPKLSRGGYCIIDDYALRRCRKAVDDFRAHHDIRSALCEIDWTGVYWRKE